MTALSFVDILMQRAEQQESDLAYCSFENGNPRDRSGCRSVTYGAIEGQARQVAAALQEHVKPGDRVILSLPTGLEFIAALFGCWYAGAVAVPVYPPDPMRLELSGGRLRSILASARPALIITGASTDALSREAVKALGPLANVVWQRIEQLMQGDGARWTGTRIPDDHVALLQYTSGSTSDPKGVILTHRCLVANQRAIAQAMGQGADTVGASWLPVYHDMGLIGMLLYPTYLGGRVYLMSPQHFAQRPLRWLEMISEFRATLSGAPNFAYELCARRRRPEVEPLDLSSWRLAFCGSEPISAATLRRFSETFARAGFRQSALFPCYGLAEASLLVSGGPWPRPALSTRSLPTAHDDEGAPGFCPSDVVGCGSMPDALEVRIVDPLTAKESPRGEIGEIWVRGESVAKGYWELPGSTEETFGGRIEGLDASGEFLRTGDLGFLADGELFVTGRLKDLIILRGRKIYPQDLERAVEESCPRVRRGCGAAFAVHDVNDGDGRVAVVYEFRGSSNTTELDLATIREALWRQHNVAVSAIVLVEPHSVPKTSSGKIRRRECQRLFMNESLVVVAQWQGSA